MTAFLYVIGNKELPSTVKVGITNNLNRRRSEIQTGSSEPIDVLHKWQFGSIKEARQIEKESHSRLSKWRTTGEWFDIYVDDAITLIEQVINKDTIADKNKEERMNKVAGMKAELQLLRETGSGLSKELSAAHSQLNDVRDRWFEHMKKEADLKDEINKLDY